MGEELLQAGELFFEIRDGEKNARIAIVDDLDAISARNVDGADVQQ